MEGAGLFWNVLHWLYINFDWSVVAVTVIGGAWNFWFQGPALAERGFRAEARLAAWGGLLSMVGSVVLFLALQVAAAYLAL